MEQTYEIPTTGHSSKKERDIFWERTIAEQKLSGISATKFCQQHQIPFSIFKNRQYRLRLKERRKACGKQVKNTESETAQANGFVQMQIAEVSCVSEHLSLPYEQSADIKIIFKNCPAIEITLQAKQEFLAAIIEQVSKLPC